MSRQFPHAICVEYARVALDYGMRAEDIKSIFSKAIERTPWPEWIDGRRAELTVEVFSSMSDVGRVRIAFPVKGKQRNAMKAFGEFESLLKMHAMLCRKEWQEHRS